MGEPGSLRYAVVEITNRCNLRCPHCASTSGVPRENEMSTGEIRALLESVRALGGEEVTIIGGEALLRPDWLDISRSVGELGMRLVLISNGLLLDERAFERLRELRPHLVGISIDGATRETYARLRRCDGFDRATAALRRLRDDGNANVNAITTFMRENLDEFDAFVRLFAGTGITWQVQIANRGGRRFGEDRFLTRDQYARLAMMMRDAIADRPDLRLRPMDDFGYFPIDPKLRFLHQTWCGCIAGVELIGVRSNGDVMGCLSLGDDFVEANVRETPLETIWTSGRFFDRFRRKAERLEGECASCPHGPECGAGCSSIAWSAAGTLARNPYCIRSLEVEAALRVI